MERSENERAVINTKKLDDSTLVDKNGNICGFWFKSEVEAKNPDLMVGLMVLQKMRGRTIRQSDFDACRKGACEVVPSNGGFSVLFPSAG